MPLKYYRIRITYLKFRGRHVVIFNDILFSKNTRCHDRDFYLTQPRPQGLLAFHIGKREDPGDEVGFNCAQKTGYERPIGFLGDCKMIRKIA